MSRVVDYPKGTILEFTSGEYSDFRTDGVVVTLRRCQLLPLQDAFKAEWKAEKPREDWDNPGTDDFIAWLVANQHVAPVQCSPVHLGSYELNIEV